MTHQKPLLIAQSLGFSYGQKKIFDSIDLSIDPREIVCLVGASGCGKSTLLRLLAGLDEPSSGDVIVGGCCGPTRTAKASVVFQSPTLLPWLNVTENIAFGLNFSCRSKEERSQRHARIAQALEQVGLTDHAHKRPNALSGGMAQRVALARALARAPEIIYLDEPFSALDAITRESMQDLLLAMAKEHQSAALLVTHDIDEALRVGDRVLLLAGSPARIVGEWRPQGASPRQHRSTELHAMREEILNALSFSTSTDEKLCEV